MWNRKQEEEYAKCTHAACKGSDQPNGESFLSALEHKASEVTSTHAFYKKECPPDSKVLGRHTWTFLHSIAAYYPQQPSPAEQQEMHTFMHTFSRIYPCSWCASHLQSYLESHPLTLQSQSVFSYWMCDMHNDVNQRLNKPLFPCEDVDKRWKTGKWNSTNIDC